MKADRSHPEDDRGDVTAASGQGSTEIELVAVNENVAIEKLRGREALSHLYNLFSRKPQAFEAARKDLEERGFRPTDTVYVERTIRLAGKRGPAAVSARKA